MEKLPYIVMRGWGGGLAKRRAAPAVPVCMTSAYRGPTRKADCFCHLKRVYG